VRQIDRTPAGVVESGRFGTGQIAAVETPAIIEAVRLSGVGGERSGGRDRDEPRSDKRFGPKKKQRAREKSKA
jgi:hypothetical protein